MRNLIAFIFCFSSYLSLPAQRSLQPGDEVPDIVFHRLFNHSSGTAKLSDFRGKIVILDFWATWCASCIRQFGKLDTIQRKLKDEVQILLVNSPLTGEDSATVAQFYTKFRKQHGFALGLISTVQDSASFGHFPHRLLPHYVWIDRGGRFLGATDPSALTEEAIHALYSGQPFVSRQKVDMDTQRPLFLAPMPAGDSVLSYSICVKGFTHGLPSGARTYKSDAGIYRVSFTNRPLQEIYFSLIYRIDRTTGDSILIVGDAADFSLPADPAEHAAWYEAHARTIDYILPAQLEHEFYEGFLKWINTVSGYAATKEGGKWVVRKVEGL